MVMKVAALQIDVSNNKQINLNTLESYMYQMSNENVDLVVLPEMFICPYQTHLFESYAEQEGEMSWMRLSELAKKYEVYLVAGSVPELYEGNIIHPMCLIVKVNKSPNIGKYICLT